MIVAPDAWRHVQLCFTCTWVTCPSRMPIESNVNDMICCDCDVFAALISLDTVSDNQMSRIWYVDHVQDKEFSQWGNPEQRIESHNDHLGSTPTNRAFKEVHTHHANALYTSTMDQRSNFQDTLRPWLTSQLPSCDIDSTPESSLTGTWFFPVPKKATLCEKLNCHIWFLICSRIVLYNIQ